MLYRKIIIILIAMLIIHGCNIKHSKGTEIPQEEINSISYADYNSYSAAQRQIMEQYNNTFLFSRATDATERSVISNTKYRGIYVNFAEIVETETSLITPTDYRAIDPSDSMFISHTVGGQTVYLAKFWDNNYRQARLNTIPDINNGLDWVFIDTSSLKPFSWIIDTLPTQIDTDAEWRTEMLGTISWARTNISSDKDLSVNSIQNNGTDPQYDGFDAIGTGYSDYGLMEGFVDITSGTLNQLRTMQLANRAKTLSKRVMVKSPYSSDEATRLSYIAKYLLVGDGYYTDYALAGTAWAPAIPEDFPENRIEWGNPIDPVHSDIINGTINGTIYTRRWDSGFVGIVNMTASTQNIPEQWLGYKRLSLSGNPQIDTNGTTTGKWELVPLTDTQIAGYTGIVIHPGYHANSTYKKTGAYW